jgi:uncharacterized membrane protein YfcA
MKPIFAICFLLAHTRPVPGRSRSHLPIRRGCGVIAARSARFIPHPQRQSSPLMEPTALLIVAATFLLAGTVKGVIGLGLPTVSLALLTATLGLQPAMALMLAPSFTTNLWQAVTGGHGRAILARLWPFLLAATATIWIGAAMAAFVDVALLSALLGGLLAIYAVIGLGGSRLPVARLALPPKSLRWAGPLAGCVNGVLTGMTGSFVVPGVPYLQTLGLPRDMLIQAMGALFTLSTAALGLALAGRGLLSTDLGLQSVAAIPPALLGMVLGRWLRGRLSEAAFRKVFFAALLVLGFYIIARSLG